MYFKEKEEPQNTLLHLQVIFVWFVVWPSVLKNHTTGKSMWWLSGIRIFYMCSVSNLLLDEYGTSEGQQDKWHSAPSAVPLDRLYHPEVFYLSQPWFICEMMNCLKNDGFYFHMFHCFHGVWKTKPKQPLGSHDNFSQRDRQHFGLVFCC